MTGRLIFLRHGQTSANVDRALDTQPPGKPLTDLGKQQAFEAGKLIAELAGASDGDPGRLQAIVSSMAVRAQETADIAARSIERVAGLDNHHFEVGRVAGIHEISAGRFEDRTDHAAYIAYMAAFWGMLNKQPGAMIEGGETAEQVMGRFMPAVESLITSWLSPDSPRGGDNDVVVVSHGALLRTFAVYATAADPEFIVNNYLGNGKLMVVEPGGRPFGQWKLLWWASRPMIQ